ncbi:HTH-type sugar sensing transcriptional regulator TrmBL1 [uncultured archaeon]|nr:HTH-type sugar sensing transcriptional regulator TrmBL1 [uncultured archaeon]
MASHAGEALRNLGLTDHESRVYLALAELGQSKVGDIIRLSGIPASKIYITLEKLLTKGLISYVVAGKHKTFRISDPSALSGMLEKKESEVNALRRELSPLVQRIRQVAEKKEETSTKIYVGLAGFKSVIDSALESGGADGMRALGVPIELHELAENYLLDWNKRRIRQRMPMRIIYEPGSKYGRVREKMKYTDVRYLPPDIVPLSWLYIFGDNLALCSFHPEFTIILVKSSSISQSYRKYYDLIWEKSREK